MILYSHLIQPFIEYGFMRHALAACLALSISGAPLGVFLSLRRMTLVGDAMSHAILPGVAVAFMIFGASIMPMVVGGLIAGMIIVMIAGGLTKFTLLKEDASFTGLYVISLALGVLLVSIHGSNIDLMHILFGNVLAIDDHALLLVAAMATISAVILSVIYRGLIIECFDGSSGQFAKRSNILRQTFFLLLVLNLVCAFQVLGTLMALGIIVLPAIACGFWSRNIDKIVISSIVVAFLASYSGLVISYNFDIPSGPAIVLAAGAFYIFSAMFGRFGSVIANISHKKHYKD